MRVIVVYSRVGGGHLSAARALGDELEATGRCSVRLVDAYVDIGRFPVTLFPALYAQLARNHPHVWWLIYNSTSGPGRRLDPSMVVGRFLRAGFARLVEHERPDIIISVLPAINQVLAHAAASIGARLEVVLTDWHAVHPFWQARGVSHYTAPTDTARADLVRYGAPPPSIDVVGIPVRRQFSSPGLPRVEAEQPPTILAMVGAEGSPRSLRNLAKLATSDVNAQLLVVCGRNARLRRQVERLPARMPVRALGFVEDVAALMRSADVLVTKAGGLTLAEAFCCGVPVVVHDVLPGQEAGNLEYVLAQRAAAYAPTPRRLVETVGELVGEAPKRQCLAARGAHLARPDAAREIGARVLARFDA